MNEDAVRWIRANVGKESLSKMGARFGVTKGMIWAIIQRKTWAHV